MKNPLHKLSHHNNKRLSLSTSSGLPMGIRLFLLLIVLVITIVLGVIAILLITGTFTAGLAESEQLVKNELQHTSGEISQQYGQLSVQAIEFSEELSRSIENQAKLMGISVSDLPNHPDKLEKIISDQFDITYFSLEKFKSSGVFFILDATVNPTLYNAQNSKAGLYLKNMEPNIINASHPTIIELRGFPSVGRNNSLSLHTQWRMEFDVSSAPYYHLPMEAARTHQDLPLSRLYYWTSVLTLPDTSEEIMICSVPLIDSQGNVFGVCGLDISSMFFKLAYMPQPSSYNRLFCILAPYHDSSIDLQQSMAAGGYSSRLISKSEYPLTVSKNKRSFYTYFQDENT